MIPRSSRPLQLLLLLVLVIICMTPFDIFSSQQPQEASPSTSTSEQLSGQTYRVSVDLVNVICSVFDKDTNSFVTSLTRDDFEIYEDGEKQVIENFARETNVPLTIAMLIDTSNSVKPSLQFEKETATSFFHTVLGEKDRAMVVEFDPGVNLVHDFTNDPNKLAGKIADLKAGGMGTKLYDAIYRSCHEKLIRETGRKSIIILSDGGDQYSVHNIDQSIEMALRAEAIIFGINVTTGSLFGVGDDPKGTDALKKLVEETGGRLFAPYEDELYETFQKINQELRSQYSIGYTSTNSSRDGRYRKIEIKIREGGFKLNYRKGYYAPES
ncbi:MAG: VWA domain-containing protein [Acidobacteriota bacterium]